MTVILAVLIVGLMVFLAHALEDIFARTKIPDVLILLALGLLLGPVFHFVEPSQLGAVGPVFTTLTLVIILFEGGLGLDLEQVFHGLAGALGLTFFNFAATLAVTLPLARILLGLDWMSAAILGAALGGTSSAVVIPMVRRLRLGERTRTALALESALSDVLVIVVALGLMQAQQMGSLKVGPMLGSMLASFLLAAVIGVVGGLAWSLALSRIHGLQNSIFTTPAFVCIVYALVELLGYSGAIAALAMGIALGNLGHLPKRWVRRSGASLASLNDTERAVFAEVVFLLKTFFFLYIGVSIHLGGWRDLWIGLLLVAALYAARIPVVHASLRPSTTSGDDALASASIVPKGLAAAVVASIPVQMGLPHAEAIRNTTFAVVLLSILATAALVFLVEHRMVGLPGRWLFLRYAKGIPDPAPAPESAEGSTPPQA